MENQLPLVIFDIKNKGNLRKIVCGEKIGTRINN
jgi:uridylate kinase